MRILRASRPVTAARRALPLAVALLITCARPSAGSPLPAEPLALAAEADGAGSLAGSGQIKDLDRQRSGKATRGPGSPFGTLEAGACFTPASIACNTVATGTLTIDDCRLPADDSFYDVWTFGAMAGDRVVINMEAGYDTFLFLFDPDGNEVARNDDVSDTNTNSRIEFTINASGTWTIYANAFDEDQTGPYSLDLSCTFVTPPPPPPTCTSSSTALCLNNARFRVSVSWSVPSQGTSGVGTASALTSDTGYFWFFSANNVELVIKVVDGRAFNNFFWVFYGALSDVQYTITVTDTVAGTAKTYTNSQGRLASVADVTAFPGGTAKATGAPPPSDLLEDAARPESRDVARLMSASAPLVCQSDPTTLCVNGVRFDVRVAWRVPTQGTSGAGRAVSLTSDTGYFWFFTANNVELVLKVVDGRAFNGFFWVFYGALSDVEYTITVTDTVTGAVRTYTNPQGRLASVADVTAF